MASGGQTLQVFDCTACVLARTAHGFACTARVFDNLFGYFIIMAKIYVGNLPFTATEDAVRTLFSAHGAVQSVALPTDRETGRPRGFGFVEMSSTDAAAAIGALNGHSMEGRSLRVNEAQDKPAGGGGQNRSGGGFRSGNRW